MLKFKYSKTQKYIISRIVNIKELKTEQLKKNQKFINSKFQNLIFLKNSRN